MKIEIDLNDILQEEYGASENVAESIHRQIVAHFTSKIEQGIGKKIDAEISSLIKKKLEEAVEGIMPSFIDEILDAKYTPVDRFGDRSTPTTFRGELIKTIQNEMVYKPCGDSYHRDRENYFTKSVRAILEEQTKAFQKDFNAIVNTEFSKSVLEQAVNQLKAKLKLP